MGTRDQQNDSIIGRDSGQQCAEGLEFKLLDTDPGHLEVEFFEIQEEGGEG